MRADLGVNPDHVLSVQVSLPRDRGYEQFDSRIDFYRRLVSGLDALPGVIGAGAIGTLPMGGNDYSRTFDSIGQTVFEQGKQPDINYSPVTPTYFEAVGMRFVKGRGFSDGDGP